jgi:hypothetical protein
MEMRILTQYHFRNYIFLYRLADILSEFQFVRFYCDGHNIFQRNGIADSWSLVSAFICYTERTFGTL